MGTGLGQSSCRCNHRRRGDLQELKRCGKLVTRLTVPFAIMALPEEQSPPLLTAHTPAELQLVPGVQLPGSPQGTVFFFDRNDKTYKIPDALACHLGSMHCRVDPQEPLLVAVGDLHIK